VIGVAAWGTLHPANPEGVKRRHKVTRLAPYLVRPDDGLPVSLGLLSSERVPPLDSYILTQNP